YYILFDNFVNTFYKFFNFFFKQKSTCEKFYYNISITKDGIKEILKTEGWYSLIIPKKHLKFDSMDKLVLVNDLTIMILKCYIDKFFKYEKAKWEDRTLEYQELNLKEGPLSGIRQNRGL